MKSVRGLDLLVVNSVMSLPVMIFTRAVSSIWLTQLESSL